uniref:Uncharacterized protein n=1 Tax=Photinus pyralis TaxID=7054 RepID=A0A1Y1LZF8_PHOPY
MNDRRRSRVQKRQTLQYLSAPRLQHLRIDLLESPQVRFESSAEHQFGDEDDALLFVERRLPVVVKSHDVRMLQLLEHLGLLAKSKPLRLVQFLLLQLAPRDRDARLSVQPTVDGLKRTSPYLLFVLEESPARTDRDRFVNVIVVLDDVILRLRRLEHDNVGVQIGIVLDLDVLVKHVDVLIGDLDHRVRIDLAEERLREIVFRIVRHELQLALRIVAVVVDIRVGLDRNAMGDAAVLHRLVLLLLPMVLDYFRYLRLIFDLRAGEVILLVVFDEVARGQEIGRGRPRETYSRYGVLVRAVVEAGVDLVDDVRGGLENLADELGDGRFYVALQAWLQHCRGRQIAVTLRLVKERQGGVLKNLHVIETLPKNRQLLDYVELVVENRRAAFGTRLRLPFLFVVRNLHPRVTINTTRWRRGNVLLRHARITAIRQNTFERHLFFGTFLLLHFARRRRILGRNVTFRRRPLQVSVLARLIDEFYTFELTK